MIIEADGAQHDVDRGRDLWFERAGYRTIRFGNDAVRREFDGVARALRANLGIEGF